MKKPALQRMRGEHLIYVHGTIQNIVAFHNFCRAITAMNSPIKFQARRPIIKRFVSTSVLSNNQQITLISSHSAANFKLQTRRQIQLVRS